MAEVTKSVIGKLTGTLGNMVFRNIGDKVVIYMRPHNQKISNTEESVNNRGKFGLTSLLAKYARLLPGIEDIWNSSDEPGRSAYTKLIKGNSKSTAPDRLTLSNRITPLGFINNVVSYAMDSIKFEIEYWLNDDAKEKIFAPYNANLLIFLYDLKDPAIGKKNNFITETHVIEEDIISGNTKLEFIFDKTTTNTILLYNKTVIFFTLTKKVDTQVFWTTSFSAEMSR